MQLPIGDNQDSPTGVDHPGFSTEHTPHEALGGEARVRELVDAFYDHMDAETRFAGVRSLHQPDLTRARDKLFKFLSGWLGGPQLYIEQYGHPRLHGRHMPFPIGETERDQWLECMGRAMDDLSIGGEIRSFLDQRFAHVANFMRNQ